MITEAHMRAVKRLEIRARRRVDTLFGGSYHSAFKGRGIEFAEVREYEPGDDVRTIDWNVTARCGKPFIKRFEEERQLTVILAVDCAWTSGFGTVRRSKQALMGEVAAVIALAAARNNDRVGLCLFGSDMLAQGKTLHVEPSKGRTHTTRLIRELVEARPGGSPTDLGSVCAEIGRTHKRRCIVFVISDFLSGLSNSGVPSWAQPLKMLGRKHEIIAAQCTDPAEFRLPRAGVIRMDDPIRGGSVLLDTGSRKVREHYERRAATENAEIVDALRSARIDHVELSTERDAIDDLARFLRMRGGR